jgi:hypothetical protein
MTAQVEIFYGNFYGAEPEPAFNMNADSNPGETVKKIYKNK